MTNIRKVLGETEIASIYRDFYANNPSAHPTEFAREIERAVLNKLIKLAMKQVPFDLTLTEAETVILFLENPNNLETF